MKSTLINREVYMLRTMLLGSVMLVALTTEVMAADKVKSFTPEQQKDIGVVVHQYLLDNPDILIEVSQKLKSQRMDSAQKDANKVISQNMNQLVNTGSPAAGNLDGSIYVIEFFDYQCGHCKHMVDVVKDLVATNNKVKVIYKDFAVLGPNSQLASRVALASSMQGKYSEMHDALMKSPKLTKESMIQTAKDLGLNVKKLEADMYSNPVNKSLADNAALAKKIGINGTPAFIIAAKPAGEEMKIFFVPGAIDKNTMQEYVKKTEARN